MSINIQRNQKKRVVIVGGGLGGLRLAEDLYGAGMQVVLIDKNNFHQFPPLIYQIASAGIDPSSISFPFRQIFRKRKDFYFRMAEARMVDTEKKILQTSIGKIDYDYLVLAAGATTNFFGNKNIEDWAMPMKTGARPDLRHRGGATGAAQHRHCGRRCHRRGDCRSAVGDETLRHSLRLSRHGLVTDAHLSYRSRRPSACRNVARLVEEGIRLS